jgi:hypothetical protein
MGESPKPPKTYEAIRDALGLVRLLYAARTRAAGEEADPHENDALLAAMRELRAVLPLARHEDGSLGHRAACARAARAMAQLVEELAFFDPSVLGLAVMAHERVLGLPKGREG